MKKLLIVASLFAASIAPAHAISESYRAQLEREGRTQMDDVKGAYQAPAYKPGNMKPIHVKKYGIDFKRSRDGFAYVNGMAALPIETEKTVTVYQQGEYTVLVYVNGSIVAKKGDKSLGRMN